MEFIASKPERNQSEIQHDQQYNPRVCLNLEGILFIFLLIPFETKV